MRGRLLIEYVVPVTQRRDLVAWLTIGKQLLLNKLCDTDLPPPIYHHDPELVARLASDPHFEARTISRCHLRNYHFSVKDVIVFQELLAFLTERGIEVVIFHPPVRAEYFDYLASDPRMQSEFETFRSFARDLAKEYRVIYWETLQDAGLDCSAVVDYGHFSREGAVRFTNRLYDEWLRRGYPQISN